MTIHPTLEAARAAAAANPAIVRIIEIETAAGEIGYIGAKTGLAGLQVALKGATLPGTRRLIAEHPLRCEAEVRAAVDAHLATECRCERCGAHVDGRTAYQQRESIGGGRQVVAYYCDSCRTVLQAVGAGERTAMDERAAERPSAEPYTKAD